MLLKCSYDCCVRCFLRLVVKSSTIVHSLYELFSLIKIRSDVLERYAHDRCFVRGGMEGGHACSKDEINALFTESN